MVPVRQQKHRLQSTLLMVIRSICQGIGHLVVYSLVCSNMPKRKQKLRLWLKLREKYTMKDTALLQYSKANDDREINIKRTKKKRRNGIR